jgi:hypothetical protein
MIPLCGGQHGVAGDHVGLGRRVLTDLPGQLERPEAAGDRDGLVSIGSNGLRRSLLAVLCHQCRIDKLPLCLQSTARIACPVCCVIVSRSSRAEVGCRVATSGAGNSNVASSVIWSVTGSSTRQINTRIWLRVGSFSLSWLRALSDGDRRSFRLT